MRDEGRAASLTYDLEPLRLKTDASVNLGVIVAEWVTNAYKYAYPGSQRRDSRQPEAIARRSRRTHWSRTTASAAGTAPSSRAPALARGSSPRWRTRSAREVDYLSAQSRHRGAAGFSVAAGLGSFTDSDAPARLDVEASSCVLAAAIALAGGGGPAAAAGRPARHHPACRAAAVRPRRHRPAARRQG